MGRIGGTGLRETTRETANSNLTEIFQEDGQTYICFTKCKEKCQNNHIPSCQCKVVTEAMKKLRAYEEIEEQEALLDLLG